MQINNMHTFFNTGTKDNQKIKKYMADSDKTNINQMKISDADKQRT